LVFYSLNIISGAHEPFGLDSFLWQDPLARAYSSCSAEKKGHSSGGEPLLRKKKKGCQSTIGSLSHIISKQM